MAERIAIRSVIHGRVQGVNYRAWCREQAERRGLAGWVQNMPDGTVAAEFVGPRGEVEDMLAACREGPLDARVERIETEEGSPPEMSAFRINR